jgi:hypothetical protein
VGTAIHVVWSEPPSAEQENVDHRSTSQAAAARKRAFATGETSWPTRRGAPRWTVRRESEERAGERMLRRFSQDSQRGPRTTVGAREPGSSFRGSTALRTPLDGAIRAPLAILRTVEPTRSGRSREGGEQRPLDQSRDNIVTTFLGNLSAVQCSKVAVLPRNHAVFAGDRRHSPTRMRFPVPKVAGSIPVGGTDARSRPEGAASRVIRLAPGGAPVRGHTQDRPGAEAPGRSFAILGLCVPFPCRSVSFPLSLRRTKHTPGAPAVKGCSRSHFTVYVKVNILTSFIRHPCTPRSPFRVHR